MVSRHIRSSETFFFLDLCQRACPGPGLEYHDINQLKLAEDWFFQNQKLAYKQSRRDKSCLDIVEAKNGS